jgi:hypothetical protein
VKGALASAPFVFWGRGCFWTTEGTEDHWVGVRGIVMHGRSLAAPVRFFDKAARGFGMAA